MATFLCSCAVSASIRYGYYGGSRLLLGPGSSRLIKTTPLFVEQVEVINMYNSNNDDDHVLLYAFKEKPELSSQVNWTTSKFLVVAPYSRKVINPQLYLKDFLN